MLIDLKQVLVEDKYSLGERSFFSRRNMVYLKEINIKNQSFTIVVKKHTRKDKALQEAKTLIKHYNQQVKVPLCYGHIDNIVCSEYIPGILLNELVDNTEVYGYDWISQLAVWYSHFHQVNLTPEGKVLLKDDNNLRNFILHDGVVYGLDFEESTYGLPEQDIGECSAYILTNSPAFTQEKFSIVKDLIDNYLEYNNNITNIESIKKQITENLKVLAKRREKQRDEILSNLNTVERNL